MSARIPADTLQAIRERANIVEVVSGYVSLRRTGRNHSGLCPFHAEKTPSFTVSDERGAFHCFGCGEGGDVFKFIMRIENLEFLDAVRFLAQKVGVEIQLSEKDSANRSERDRLLALNEHVQRRFLKALQGPEGDPARRYLQQRGLSEEVIERYGLGFCPRSGTGLVPALSSKPPAVNAALSLGLIGRRDDGRMFERLWVRITFPIRDAGGALLGFGGRGLFEQRPKYLNSPESPLFHKGNVLYGIYEAKSLVRERQRIVLVEGYMDAIALADKGIGEAVASLGTALTPAQLKLAKRFSSNIIAFFDGDRAGQQAAMRAFETSLEAQVQALGAFLPEGKDPDDFVRERGMAATQELLAGAIPLSNYFVAQLSPPETAPLGQRLAAAERIASALTKVRDPIEFGMIARHAAERLGVAESLFREKARQPERARTLPPVPEGPTEETFRPEEKILLELAVASRRAAEAIAAREILSLFESQSLANAIREVIAAWERDETPSGVIARVVPQVGAWISAVLVEAVASSEEEQLKAVADCCVRIEDRRLESSQRERKLRLKQKRIEADPEGFREEAVPYLEMKRRMHADRARRQG